MRVGIREWFVVVMGVLALSACAKNTILREDASSLSADMATVQAQTRQFYVKHSAARADFLLRLIADDPECKYYFPLYVVTIREPTRAVRCATEKEIEDISEGHPPPGATVRVYAQPQDSDYAALQLIAVVAEYQAIMAQLVADPEIDFGADLDALAKRADELRDRYGKMLGTGTDPKSGAFKEEMAALTELLNLIGTARKDQITVDGLKEIVGENGLKVEDALRQIVLRYRSNDALLLNNLEADIGADRIDEFNQGLEKAKNDRGQRLKLLRAFAEEQKSEASQLTKTDPLATGLDGLMKTHQAFRLALLEGKLTDEQRRRIAEKTLKDLKAWFNAIRQIALLL